MAKMGMIFSVSNARQPFISNTPTVNKFSQTNLKPTNNPQRRPTMGVFLSMNMNTRVGGCGCGK
jgi:hypothetical protein